LLFEVAQAGGSVRIRLVSMNRRADTSGSAAVFRTFAGLAGKVLSLRSGHDE
jgi:hypothetical protein